MSEFRKEETEEIRIVTTEIITRERPAVRDEIEIVQDGGETNVIKHPSDCQQQAAMSAHQNLNAELVSLGQPESAEFFLKTTDLDNLLKIEEEGQEVDVNVAPAVTRDLLLGEQRALEAGRNDRRSCKVNDRKMEREDIVTVKYLPIKMSPLTLAEEELQESKVSAASNKNFHLAQENNGNFKKQQLENCLTQGKSIDSLTDKERISSCPCQSSSGTIGSASPYSTPVEDSNVRIVEHIRKNLTLFESNREIYEYCQENNRGYLQSLLDKKSSQNNNSQLCNSHSEFLTRPPSNSKFTDQYTQYRASDLINQHQSCGRSGEPKGKTGCTQSQAKTPLPRVEHQEEHKGLQSSLNSLLSKLPLKKFALKSGPEAGLTNQTNRLQPKKFNQKVEKEENLYKVPVALVGIQTSSSSQTCSSFTASQSLYLIPAPDYSVHIATRVVREIILAHRRYCEKSKLKLERENLSVGEKLLNKLNTTYSSFRKRTKRQRKQKGQFRKVERSKSFTGSRRRVWQGESGVYGSTRQARVYSNLQGSSLQEIREPTLDHSVSKIKAKVKMPTGKTDKANIIDNKDGTIKISYEPKEIGQHEISLRYNDEPIDESPIVFYVDAVGASKKKITAYGAGLTHGLVGDQCKFTINTGGLGSAKLNVLVEGPSKTQVNLQDNKDGTITVNYLPLVAGEYKIKISFDGKQVVGSPFKSIIGDEGRQRSHLQVGRGSEHTLDLKINEEDLKTLDALIITPCGLEEPCGLKLLNKSNQLAIVFTPREQGEHVVNVRRRGNHIGGSPFKFDVLSRDIGDAKQVKVSGNGLREGKTGVENELLINTREAGYGGLSVALEGQGRSEILSKDVSSVLDGTIKLAYKVSEPGQYSLSVKYADHVVPGSPFSIKVSGQGSNLQKEILKKFRKLVPNAEANNECHFSFKAPGVSAYDLSAKIHSPQGNAEDASLKDLGDYVYQVTFIPKEVGLYSLSIRNKDIHLDGSPFPFSVGPLVESGAHRVRCGGPGLMRGSCQKLNEFNIFTREAGAGEVLVLIEGPSKAEIKYTDRKDGSCHVGYKVNEAGEYRISVLFNDQEVPESPFFAHIMPDAGDVAKIELGPLPPESMIQLNKPYNMTVIMNGAKGNIESKVKLPSGLFEDCFASPIDAENWGVRFIPREFGVYQVHIKFNKGSSHIPQSPFNVRVGHDNADPAAILVHGNGLKQATVNSTTDFTIETCQAGHALLELNIEGPSKVSMGCAEIDEGYKVNYTPLSPGDYLISIKYNGCHIAGSPFKVHAIKPPGSRTVADVGSHEIASLALATTDREAKQKVENMPKFKSDASRVYCRGMGLKKAFSGKPNTLTVNCSEAGFNMISASFLGPTRQTIHECSCKHMGGSIYEIKYTCKDRGDAILVVKYGDEQIPGSPFRLECV